MIRAYPSKGILRMMVDSDVSDFGMDEAMYGLAPDDDATTDASPHRKIGQRIEWFVLTIDIFSERGSIDIRVESNGNPQCLAKRSNQISMLPFRFGCRCDIAIGRRPWVQIYWSEGPNPQGSQAIFFEERDAPGQRFLGSGRWKSDLANEGTIGPFGYRTDEFGASGLDPSIILHNGTGSIYQAV